MTNASFANLSGKTAVITGASSGIGRAIAVELANAGAELFLTCGSAQQKLRETIAALPQGVRVAGTFAGDLAEPGVCDRLIDEAWSRIGSAPVWINNAGVDLLTGDEANLAYDQKLQRLWNVDVAATVLLSRSVGQRMKSAGQGVIVNVGWDQADRGMAGDSGELFATAKNAIMGFTRSLAVSLAPQVRVNCIAPGWIKTAWGEGASEYWQERVRRETPLERWGTPQDIAKAVRFLCSDEASYITGQILNVNGGAVR
jgi:3-oxoacyl-[acyl-carrier protein] reductase